MTFLVLDPRLLPPRQALDIARFLAVPVVCAHAFQLACLKALVSPDLDLLLAPIFLLAPLFIHYGQEGTISRGPQVRSGQ